MKSTMFKSLSHRLIWRSLYSSFGNSISLSRSFSSSHKSPALPLSGLLVVTLEHAVAAPYCSCRLADAGARVIKIERENGGDFARGYDKAVHGESAYFVWLNRGKQSVTLDIKKKDDAALLHRMLKKADIFIQNMAVGAAARSGFGSADLRAVHEKLITLDVSGYGTEGDDYEHMRAYDLLIQAESGLASVTGPPNTPSRVGVSAADIACGMHAYMSVLEALHQRNITGKGIGLKTSLFEGMAEWMTVPLLTYEYSGKAQRGFGLQHPTICPYGAFRTKEGRSVMIAIQNNREFERLCDVVLHVPELSKDKRFITNEDRVAHRPEMEKIIADIFAVTPRQEILDRLKLGQIAYGEINDVTTLSAHPALRRTEVDSPTGKIKLISQPWRFDGPDRTYGPIPALGEHTDLIRSEFQ